MFFYEPNADRIWTKCGAKLYFLKSEIQTKVKIVLCWIIILLDWFNVTNVTFFYLNEIILFKRMKWTVVSIMNNLLFPDEISMYSLSTNLVYRIIHKESNLCFLISVSPSINSSFASLSIRNRYTSKWTISYTKSMRYQ